MVRPAVRREGAHRLVEKYDVSERRACRVVGLHRSTHRYQSRREEPAGLRGRLREHAARRRRWGYKKLTILLRHDGYEVNHKRVYRIYRDEKLLVHLRRRRRRCAALARVVLQKAAHPLASEAIRRSDEMRQRLGPGHRTCVVCGEQIVKFDEYFTVGFLTSDPGSPVYQFNYLQAHRAHLPKWEKYPLFRRLVEEFQSSVAWDGPQIVGDDLPQQR